MSEKATEKEKIQVEVMGAYDLTGKLVASQIENNIKNNIIGATASATTKEGTDEKSFPVKVTYNGHKYQVTEEGKVVGAIDAGDTAPSDSNAEYISGSYEAMIPAGYRISATESSIENGLVVTDPSGNEWVWIPVSDTDLEAMYQYNNSGWTMSRLSEGEEVKTYYSSKSNIISGKTRGLPSESTQREPDVLVDSSKGDATSNNNITLAGLGENITEMSKNIRDDYKKMIESVKKYGGFYVGRYELGRGQNNSPQVVAGRAYASANWYELYKKCTELGSGYTVSRMIWGCQWDQVCKFISTYTEGNQTKTRDLTDSSSYGNYTSTVKNTGSDSTYKANNIFDLAGNCWEFTQEACDTKYRLVRGGSAYGNNPVTSLYDKYSPFNAEAHISTRPILYLK